MYVPRSVVRDRILQSREAAKHARWICKTCLATVKFMDSEPSFFQDFMRFLGHPIMEMRVIDTTEGKVIFQDYSITDPAVFAQRCMEYSGRFQVYYSAQSRDGKGASYENVPALTWVPMDIDAKRRNKKVEPANEEQRQNALRNAAKVIRELRNKGIEPSLWVDTGNGALILVRVPAVDTAPHFYKTGDSVQNTLSDKINWWLHHWVKTICDDTVEVDSVGDLPRILGCPNTINTKSPQDQPRVRRIIYGDITKPPEPQPRMWDQIEDCWKLREAAVKPVEAKGPALMGLLPPHLRDLYEKPDPTADRSLILTRTMIYLANNLGYTRDKCIPAMEFFTQRIGRDKWPTAQQYDKLVAEGKIRIFNLGDFTFQLAGSNVVFFDGKGEPQLSFPSASISGLRVKQRIAKKLGLDEDIVDQAIAKLVTAVKQPKPSPSTEGEQAPTSLIERSQKLLRDPELLLYIIRALRELDLVGETRNALSTFLDMLSAKTRWPINRRWSGRSGMGKTTIVMKAAELLPPEMVKVYAGATKKTLWYDPDSVEVDENTREISLEGKVLILLEESESQEFLDEVKPLLSHDKHELEYAFVEKFGGVNLTRVVRVRGWPAYIGITTEAELREEQQTRALLGTPDYGKDKYRAIIAVDASKAAAPWSVEKTDLPKVVQEAVRQLEPRKVWIPWLPVVATQFPYDEPKSMREWHFFRSFLESIALLHQRQIPKVKAKGEEYDAAPLTILEIASEIGKAGFEETLSKLPRDAHEFANYLAEHKKEFWTYRDLQTEYGKCFGGSIGRTTLRERYVKKLEEEGLLEIDDNKKPYKITLTGERLAALTVFEKSLEMIRSEGKYLLLNHLELSADKGRAKILEATSPDGDPISTDELINILCTPRLADDVKEAISKSKDKEYALPALFLESAKNTSRFYEKKSETSEENEGETGDEDDGRKNGILHCQVCGQPVNPLDQGVVTEVVAGRKQYRHLTCETVLVENIPEGETKEKALETRKEPILDSFEGQSEKYVETAREICDRVKTDPAEPATQIGFRTFRLKEVVSCTVMKYTHTGLCAYCGKKPETLTHSIQTFSGHHQVCEDCSRQILAHLKKQSEEGAGWP